MKKTTIVILSILLSLSLCFLVYTLIQMNNVKKANVAYQQTITSTNASLEEKEKLCAEQQSTITALNEEIALKNDTLSQKEIALVELTEAHTRTQQENTDTQNNLNTCEHNTDALEASIQEKDAQITSLNEQVATLTKEKDGLSEQLASLKNDKTMLNEQVATLTKEKDGLSEQLASLENDKTMLNEQVATLTKENAALTKKVSYLDGALTRLQSAHSALMTEKETLEKSHKDLETAHQDLNEKHTTVSNQILDKETTISVLQNTLSIYKKDIEQYKTDIQNKDNEIQALNTSLKEKEDALSALTNEKESTETQLHEKISVLESSFNSTKTALTTSEKSLAEATTQISTLNSTLAQKEQALATLQTENNDLQNNIHAVKGDNLQKEEKISALEKEKQAQNTEILALTDIVSQRDKMVADLVLRLDIKNPLLKEQQTEYDEETVYGQAMALISNSKYKDAQALLLPATDEKLLSLLALCNNQCFLIDLQKGLSKRWEISHLDPALMSEKEHMFHMEKLILKELDFVSVYQTLPIQDETLRTYAGIYINALYNQLQGLYEFKQGNQDAYYQNWQIEGYNRRMETLYLLQKSYGLDYIKGHAHLTELLKTGELLHLSTLAYNALSDQLLNAPFRLQNIREKTAHFAPLMFTNTSGIVIDEITLKLLVKNADNQTVDTIQIAYFDDVAPGQLFRTSEKFLPFPLTHYEIECAYTLSSSSFRDTFSFTLTPSVQFDNAGQILLPPSAPLPFALTDAHFGFELTRILENDLYAPYLHLTFQNQSNAAQKELFVEAVFYKETPNDIWSKEQCYVLNKEDRALLPAQTLEAFLISSIGYGEKIASSSLPALFADIYVNGEFLCTLHQENVEANK